jgi:hypothetical protein
MKAILITFYVGIILSFISSFLVLYVLVKLKYKDISTYLRLYCTLIDIINTFWITFWILGYTGPGLCADDIVYFYSVPFHGFWIFYMGLAMYQIICFKRQVNKKNVLVAFLVCNFISILVICPCLVLLKFYACLDEFSDNFHLYYFGTAILLPELFIVGVMAYFYYRIRKSMKKEIGESRINNKKLFDRLYGYILLFFFFLFLIFCILLNYK